VITREELERTIRIVEKEPGEVRPGDIMLYEGQLVAVTDLRRGRRWTVRDVEGTESQIERPTEFVVCIPAVFVTMTPVCSVCKGNVAVHCTACGS
jgi:hypothetical protein